ncbi:hypothetical protein G5B41_09795 [bacterium SGD-2]|nr:hypothetical protein [bacterium SGD-2]
MNQPRLIKIGDALSQLLNVTLLPRHRETTANESISGRAHRMGWRRLERFIDTVFLPWERDHCRRSHEKDVQRARQWARMHRKR